jgi:hypothetical protein
VPFNLLFGDDMLRVKLLHHPKYCLAIQVRSLRAATLLEVVGKTGSARVAGSAEWASNGAAVDFRIKVLCSLSVDTEQR